MGLVQYSDNGFFAPRKIAEALRTTSEEVAKTAGLGKDACRDRVPTDRELGVEGAAVDVGPGSSVDDDLGPVSVEPGADPFGRIEVERVALPGDRSGGAGERRVRQSVDHGPTEATPGAGDRDAHQSAGDGGAWDRWGGGGW